MRVTGITSAPRGLGLHDHVCWVYDHEDEFRVTARDFLGEGLRAGQRIRYLATGDPSTLLGQLDGVEGFRAGLARGAVQVASIDPLIDTADFFDPLGQVRAYAAAVDDALGAGFTGLRVAADGTALIRGAERVHAFARYEHLVDGLISRRPFSALCAYSASALPAQTIGQLACMHPATNTASAQFRLYGSPHAAAALAGELDMASCRSFARALEHADLEPVDGTILIDARDLTFIDHRNLRTLSEFARRTDATVVLQTRRRIAGRLIELLDLPDVRVESPADPTTLE